MNRFALKNRPAGQPLPDGTPGTLPSMPPQGGDIVTAPTGTPGMVQVPQFDVNGQIVKDASGANVMQTVPANSTLATMMKTTSTWRGPVMKILSLLAIAAVVYGSAYYGSRRALRKARAARHESRRGSRRGATVEAV